MTEVHLSIVGKGAVEASEALLASPNITGTWQPVEGTQRDRLKSAIVHILLAASGEVLSQQIQDWYQRYQQARAENRIETVVLVAKGQRIVVENSSFEEIRQLLAG